MPLGACIVARDLSAKTVSTMTKTKKTKILLLFPCGPATTPPSLTFLFDGGGVDGDEAAASCVAWPQDVLADLSRDAREGRGDKAEGSAGLHDRPGAAGLDGQAVGRGQVPGQVRLQLEFLRAKRSLCQLFCVEGSLSV